MRRTRLLGQASTCYYHCNCKAIESRMIFDDLEKERIQDWMWEVAAFTGVNILTYCLMTNHIHLFLEVPPAPELDEKEVMRRIRDLYDPRYVYELEKNITAARKDGGEPRVEAILDTYRRRMYDLSEFMKMFSQHISQSFNRRHHRRGPLWQDRFYSTLIEGRRNAMMTTAAYIDLNPVRAGMVKDPREYRFCGYGQAMGGSKLARDGIRTLNAFLGHRDGEWRQVAAAYRRHLYLHGRKKSATDTAPGRLGFSDAEIQAVLDQNGQLSRGQLLRCRVRYLTDGLVLGSKVFVEDVFQQYREEFGVKRRTGARAMKHGDWGGLCTMRDLRREVISVPKLA